MLEELKNDADVKFEKLLLMADDIDKNGTTSGDSQMHQLVMAGILANNNDVLTKMMEEALCDDSRPEILHTIIMGIFFAQKNYSAASDYVKNIFGDKNIIDKSLEKKEALLLAADCVVNALNEGDASCRESFIRLFGASCKENSDAEIADKLLERFLSILPESGDLVHEILIEIAKDKLFDMNARIVAVDVLSRSGFKAFSETLEEIILDLNNPQYTNSEQLYLYDVASKALNLYAATGKSLNYAKVLDFLNNFNFVVEEKDDLSDLILKRIEKRLKNTNDIFNSRN